MTLRNPSRLRRAALAAAVVAGGFFAVGTAQAAPLAAPPADAMASETGLTAVHWHGGRHFGHHHRHGWGRHWGWRHHHHHHGWGWGHRHRHHHHWRHRHFF